MASLTNIQELLTTGTGTEGSLLIAKTIASVMIEEVDKFTVGRQFAARVYGPGDIQGSSIDVNLQTADSMTVKYVAEGAAIPIDVGAYTSINFKPLKYGIRPMITKEMVEDSNFALMEDNLRMASRKMAEHETSLILTALDGATNTVAGGANVTIGNITRAAQYLRDSDFEPNTYLVGPEVLTDLQNIDTFAEANKFGSNEMLARGVVGRIYGMDVVLFSGTIGTSTTSYVFDKTQAFAIAEKRPVTIERYDDYTHDLSGAVMTKRQVVRLLRASAVSDITSS